MTKLKDEHKPLLNRIAGYVTMAIAAIGFATAYFFYSAQAGLLLEQEVKNNKSIYETHVKDSAIKFNTMQKQIEASNKEILDILKEGR